MAVAGLQAQNKMGIYTISNRLSPMGLKKMNETKQDVSLQNLTRSFKCDTDEYQETSLSKSLSLNSIPNEKRVTFALEDEIVPKMPISKAEKKKAKCFAELPVIKMEGQAYDNSLFQHDEDTSILKNTTCLWKYGKKGRDVGYLGDTSDVRYVGNNVLLVTDMSNNRLQTLDIDGKLLNTCELEINTYPICATVTKEKQVILTSHIQKCIMLLSEEGGLIKIAGQGSYLSPFGIAEDLTSGYFAVTDQQNNSLTLLDNNLCSILEINPTENARYPFSGPRHVTFSDDGLIIVSDSGNHSVKVFDKNGILITNFGTYGRDIGTLRSPYGICVDHSGNILVADHYNDRISCFDMRGQWLRDVVCYYHGLRHPQGIAFISQKKLCATHGGLKATEVIVFDITKMTG